MARNERLGVAAIATALGLGLAITSQAAASPQTFTDDFNRADGAIGNGWSTTPLPPGAANYFIKNGVVTIDRPDDGTVLYRPVDFSGGAVVKATITDANGFGGLSNRFNTQFSFGSDGSENNPLGVLFFRADNNFQDSQVRLVVGGVDVTTLNVPFQFDQSITSTVHVSPTGAIDGSVTSGGHEFDFLFSPAGPIPSGGNFAMIVEGSDDRTSSFIFWTGDDVSIETMVDTPISGGIPEPGTWLLLAAGLGLTGAALRKTKARRVREAAV